MHREKTGTGITARTKVTYDDNDLATVRQDMDWQISKGGLRSFADRLAGLEEMAREILHKRGLPNVAGWLYRREGDRWVEHRNGEPLALPMLSLAAVVEAEGHAPDSVVGYAAQLLNLARFLRGALKHGDALGAARWGFDIGALVIESAMKFKHERAVLADAPLRAARVAAVKRKSEGRRAEWANWQAKDCELRKPGQKKMPRARAVKKALGLSENAQVIARHIGK